MTREEAIIRLKNGEPFSEIYDPVWDEALNMAISALKKNKGEWIYLQGLVPYKWRCNKCEKMFKTDFNYCPNCGADMRGET